MLRSLVKRLFGEVFAEQETQRMQIAALCARLKSVEQKARPDDETTKRCLEQVEIDHEALLALIEQVSELRQATLGSFQTGDDKLLILAKRLTAAEEQAQLVGQRLDVVAEHAQAARLSSAQIREQLTTACKALA